jgi:transposase
VAVSGSTVYRTKRRFVEGNLERALSEEPRPGAERKLTGKEEALLEATACASPRLESSKNTAFPYIRSRSDPWKARTGS